MTLYKGMPGEWRRPQEKEEKAMQDRQAVRGGFGEIHTYEEKAAAIKFKAHVWKVGTLGTGGLRVVLNLDKDYIRQMAMLAECQHDPEMELEFEARQSE